MHYRNFKGDQIAEIGLGTWQLGSADWGQIDPDRAYGILDTHTRLGGNFIDTADVYGMGVSETLIGNFLTQSDKKVFVATKLGRRGDHGNGWPQNFTYDFLRRHVEDSLKRLQTDQLYLEQLHCIDTESLRKGEVFDSLRKLQQEGLIKHFGVSVETTEEAFICLQHKDIASLQIIFNIFRQDAVHQFFDKASAQGTGLIARVPLASGLLTGKFNKDTRFSAKDHRNYNANGEAFNVGETFSGIDFAEGLSLARQVQDNLPSGNLAQQSIKWILSHPAITTVIPGASRAQQVESNMAAAALPAYTEETMQALSTLYQRQIRPKIRGKF